MNPYGRPKKKDSEKRVNFTCMISPETRRMLDKLKEHGVNPNIGKKVDVLITDICRANDIY